MNSTNWRVYKIVNANVLKIMSILSCWTQPQAHKQVSSEWLLGSPGQPHKTSWASGQRLKAQGVMNFKEK